MSSSAATPLPRLAETPEEGPVMTAEEWARLNAHLWTSHESALAGRLFDYDEEDDDDEMAPDEKARLDAFLDEVADDPRPPVPVPAADMPN